MDEEKKVVLITGCSSGIGESLAEEFHKVGGYIVYQTARKLKDLEGKQSKYLRNLEIDVTKQETIDNAVEEIIKEEGRIDILVNNAGYSYFSPLLEVPIDELKKIYDVNIHGVMRMIHTVVPHMIQRESGLILNISSISSVLPSIFAGPYCSSKSATSMLTHVLRQELRLFGIKVVDVQPGAIQSKFATNAAKYIEGVEYKYFSEYKDAVKVRMVQGQLGACTSAELATTLVGRVGKEDLPSRIRIGPKSTKLPLFAALLPYPLYDRVVYKKIGINGVKITEKVLSVKKLLVLFLFVVCFVVFFKFLFL